MKIFKTLLLAMVLLVLMLDTALAAHPLITDDTGTQGKGKLQLEINFEYGHENEEGTSTDSFNITTMPILSLGIIDNIDFILANFYQHVRTKQEGITTTADGISDTSMELKWRFHKKDGLSFALKPGLTLPTGDEEKALGTGKATYSLFFISTKEIEVWAFHLNFAYLRNENKLEERRNIWHASLAAEVEMIKDLKAVANVGIEKSPDRAVNTSPAFFIGGVIYSLSEWFEVDLGVKLGLTKSETDYSILTGITLRF